MKDDDINSVRRLALRDISQYLNSERGLPRGKIKDIWTVSSRALDTPEQRYLNRLLGIHKINKTNKKQKNVNKSIKG